jgi:ABC-type Fe3+/spermidine/putrescine transport system ATPase subunit
MNILLSDVKKKFGEFELDVSLEVRDGEFLTLLGPSGCGKTTALRIIAGLEEQDSGELYFDGKIMDLPLEKRNIGLVFQDYALFPHLNVFENIAFGLRVRKFERERIEKRVDELLELVRLPSYEKRRIQDLSGGEQQRVALARALAINPGLLLLDEPLSSLDAKLRITLREELKKIQKALHLTTLYVTHDQEEALSISDRIAVIFDGTIHQVGTPETIYLHPKNSLVAEFMGWNVEGTRGFKPEDISIGKGKEGVIENVEFLGREVKIKLKNDIVIKKTRKKGEKYIVGDTIKYRIEKSVRFD